MQGENDRNGMSPGASEGGRGREKTMTHKRPNAEGSA